MGTPDPLVVQRVDEGDERGEIVEVGGVVLRSAGVAVPSPGNVADVDPQEMERHVMHGPAGTDGRKLPLLVGE